MAGTDVSQIPQQMHECPDDLYLNRHVRNVVCAAGNLKWRDLGIALIGRNAALVLDVMETNNPGNVEACCSKMFTSWRSRQPKASWGQLIEALKEVHLVRLASKLEGLLLPTAESSVEQQLESSQNNQQYSHGLQQEQDNQLKLKQLMDTVRLVGFTTNWYDIGLELLDGDTSTLDMIKTNNESDIDKCCTAMLNEWLVRKPGAGLDQLITTLKSSSPKSPACSNEVQCVVKRLEVDRILELKGEFTAIFDDIRKIIESENLSIASLIIRLCSLDDKRLTVFSTDSAFREIRSIDELFFQLAKYCKIYDYELLVIFVRSTRCEKAIALLKEFKKELRLSILSGLDLLSEDGGLRDPNDFMPGTHKLVIKYDEDECTLETKNMVERIVCECFNLVKGSIIFRGVQDGCVAFVYQISSAVKSYLLDYPTEAKHVELLSQYKIKCLLIDNEVLKMPLNELIFHQVCSEKNLASIAKKLSKWEPVYMYLDITGPETIAIRANHSHDYETQKLEVLIAWKRKKGNFQGTFGNLIKAFSQQGDQEMVDTIREVAVEAYKDTTENSVIELVDEFRAIDCDMLMATAMQVGLFNNAPLETFEDASNDVKRMEVILSALMNLPKPKLVDFISSLAQQRKSVPMLIPPPLKVDVEQIEKSFRITIRNIKTHLMKCDLKDIVTNFDMVVDKKNIPYFKNSIKLKLHRCKSVADLFVRLSPFIAWNKRDVLQAVVEVSDCPEAVAELKMFEDQLDSEQSIMEVPVPQPSSHICPDPDSNEIIVSAKSIQDITKSTVGDVQQITRTVAEKGGVRSAALDLQAKNTDSSILYWLLPKSMMKSFEENIRSNLDYLYEHGIVEISIDLDIVITTGRKLRVRSLAYLTKLPPQDACPGRAEELEELPLQAPKLPERAEEIVELAHQLNTGMIKKDKEIVNLGVKVQDLERDKTAKVQECIQLHEELDKSNKDNDELMQIIQVSAAPEKVTTQKPITGISSAQHVNLLFGSRGHTAVKCGELVYIGGGVVSKASGTTPDIIQVIDLLTNQLSQLPACPVKYFSMVSIDNQLVTVGGRNMSSDNQVTNKLYCWQEATKQWEETLPPMPTSRCFHTSVVWQNFLITCGGRIDNKDSFTDCVEVLNIRSRRWWEAASLPIKAGGKHALVTSKELHLLGGYPDSAVHYCKLQALVTSNVIVDQPKPQKHPSVWKRLKDVRTSDSAAALLGGSIIIIGGRSKDTKQISSKILRYSRDEDKWQHIGNLRCGRTACMAIVLDYNSVLVTGGTVSHDGQPEWYSNSTEIVKYY